MILQYYNDECTFSSVVCWPIMIIIACPLSVDVFIGITISLTFSSDNSNPCASTVIMMSQ